MNIVILNLILILLQYTLLVVFYFISLGKGADKTIDKVIPQTSDKVGNTLLKYTTDKINNKMKENTKRGHNN